MSKLDEIELLTRNTLFAQGDQRKDYLHPVQVDLLIRAVRQFGAARPYLNGYVESDDWMAFDDDVLNLVAPND